MYIIGNNIYTAHHLYKWEGQFFRTYYRYFYLVCCSIRICQFNGMGKYMATGPGWIGKIYKTGRFDNDYGFMWKRYTTASLWVAC